MPIITTERDDILRKPEIDAMLEKADERLRCIIAFAWLFGKRINEILQLKRDDVWLEGEYFYARFTVSKKRARHDRAIPRPYLKRIRVEHPYVQHILSWIGGIKAGYIFASYGQPRKYKVRTKYKNKDGQEVIGEYEYETKGGYLSRTRVYQQVKAINPNAWLHLFRESLATYMAEHGASEEELMHWFDWDDVRTAHEYVKHGTKLTEKWSDRTW